MQCWQAFKALPFGWSEWQSMQIMLAPVNLLSLFQNWPPSGLTYGIQFFEHQTGCLRLFALSPLQSVVLLIIPCE